MTDRYPDKYQKIIELIKKCSDKEIKIIRMPIIDSSSVKSSFEKCKKHYPSGPNRLYEIKTFNVSDMMLDFSDYFQKTIINAVLSATPAAAPKSLLSE
jgi:hypothetical protein